MILFAYKISESLRSPTVSVIAPSIVSSNIAQRKDQGSEQIGNPPIQEYAVVAEKNLFHPERIIPVVKKEAEVPRPDFILYGTLIAEDVRIAYLSDKKVPRSTPGRGKRQTALKRGETLSGYTLMEVLTDRVIFVRGDDRIELRVADSVKKDRGIDTTLPAGQTTAVARAMPGRTTSAPPFAASPSGQAPGSPTSIVSPRSVGTSTSGTASGGGPGANSIQPQPSGTGSSIVYQPFGVKPKVVR